jgi:hypothetical protein
VVLDFVRHLPLFNHLSEELKSDGGGVFTSTSTRVFALILPLEVHSSAPQLTLKPADSWL